jgi:predicted enzyme related to lactoylglutathione lyase
MPDITLNLVVLRSVDLERAASFYGALGIEFSRERHRSGPEHLACQLGAVVLEIYPRDGTTEDSPARIGFEVVSVADALAAVRSTGGVVIAPPKESPWGLRAVVADPDGHRVELLESKR